MTDLLSAFNSGVPGIYRGIPHLDYLHAPIMSQSTLKHGRASMMQMKAAIDGERVYEPTDEWHVGSALHVAFLEPALLESRVVRWDGGARRGDKWESFKAGNAGRIVLTPGYYARMEGMVKSLRAHPDVIDWQTRTTATEVSAIGEYEGVAIKARCDAMTDDPLWDLKKIRDVSERNIDSTIYKLGYHIQAFLYQHIFGRERFCLAFVSATPPYEVSVNELDREWLKIGRKETTELTQRYKWCLKEDRWPARNERIRMAAPPAWLTNEFATEVTLDGDEV